MILGVCEHPAGASSLVAVAKELRQEGCEVLIVAGTDIAAKTLQDAAENFIKSDSAKEVLEQYPRPEALITGMCSTSGIIVKLLQALQGVCPRISLQGAGGGGLELGWLNPENWPDYLCVQDADMQKEFRKRWKGFPEDHVVVTGLAILDRWLGYNTERAGLLVGSALGIHHDWVVLLFAGQVERTSEELDMLVSALNDVRRDVCLIPREHPRFRTDAPEEIERWEAALARFRSGIVLDTRSWKDSMALVARADLVVGRTSNMQVEAAYLGKPVIAIISPSVTEELERTTGRNTWAWAENGSMAKATSPEELRAALLRASNGELDLRKAQERIFPRDGKTAGQRIAEFVTGLIS